LKRILHPTLKTLNLPKAGWRVFRRSVATALSEMREPVRTAQQVLGHASAQTTLAYYIQSVEESQRSAVTRLEERMLPPAG
jgi:integrase